MNNKFSLVFLTVAGLSYFQENLYGSNPLKDLRILQTANSNQQYMKRQARRGSIIQNAEKALKAMQNRAVVSDGTDNNSVCSETLDPDIIAALKAFDMGYKYIGRLIECFNCANELFKHYLKENKFSIFRWKNDVYKYIETSFPAIDLIVDLYNALNDEPEKLKIIENTFHKIDEIVEFIQTLRWLSDTVDAADDEATYLADAILFLSKPIETNIN